MKRTLYQTLGIQNPKADVEEIKRAYRKLAKANHPDRGGDPVLFKDIQEAWDVLSDPDKRAYYDKTGEIPKSVGKQINQILSCLAKTLTECLNEHYDTPDFIRRPLKDSDILASMRKKLDQGVQVGKTTIDQFEVTKTDLDAIKDRFETEDSDNCMKDLVYAQITEIEDQITQVAQTMELFTKTKEFLKSYKFKMDKYQPKYQATKQLSLHLSTFFGENNG